ncbi:helix-turn-helix domain-containing protein [Arachidicoccus terrestris]|uniref:helix-turn-helix domain-containing protein n=1 Tax=Arachidicoccus terrestris TaxID=2875539 RepID=UPI001CC6AF93|nr:helix-turn-helix transcriptional regulator [Arachidicoccus terrestris]UAY53822.1 helix-turn-helix transcriptional regulator [Arachidicoccus terrestris]
MELAHRLSQLRKEKGLTQQALAELTGTHPNVIGKYELGLAIPSVDMAGKLAHALNVSIDYLAGNDDIIVDNRLMDKIKSLLKLPEDVKNSVMYSLDKLIGKAKGSIA